MLPAVSLQGCDRCIVSPFPAYEGPVVMVSGTMKWHIARVGRSTHFGQNEKCNLLAQMQQGQAHGLVLVSLVSPSIIKVAGWTQTRSVLISGTFVATLGLKVT
jgi:hypothetical protein